MSVSFGLRVPSAKQILGASHDESGEKPEEFGINAIGDLTKRLGVGLKFKLVAVDDDQAAFVLRDPALVEVIQALEIVDAHGFLEITSAFFNLRHKIGDGRADVDHQIGELDERHHEIEEIGVVGEVAVAHHAHGMQVGGEDACVFKNGTILNDGFFAPRNGHHILKSLVEKVDLQIERPALHIFIEVFEIGVEVYGFEEGRPSVVLGKHFGECGFPAADVSGDGDVHGCRVF